MACLGIDTSNYTTSLAVLDEEARLLADKRIILPVPANEKGLQQSQALFYHVKNLPRLVEEAFSDVSPQDLRVVGVSCKPRPLEESYMPVFTAGTALAESIAALLRIPLLKTTHQEGHIAAGLWSCQQLVKEKFLVFHLSGGTSELLTVTRRPGKVLAYKIEVLGGTLDLHAGQLVDRVGVAMGLPFPCGSAFEKLAASAPLSFPPEKVIIPSAVKGYCFSFSGAETRAKKYLQEGVAPELVARAVENCIAVTMEKVARRAFESEGLKELVLVGGVSSNKYIRQRLIQRLEHPAVQAKLFFPQPEFCRDNAVGTGLIGHSMVFKSAPIYREAEKL